MTITPPSSDLNFASYLLDLNAGRGDKLAFIDDTRRLTYGQLGDRIRQFAGVLRDLGVRREERVLLLMHDTIDWPVVFLGALYAGVVPVAVNTLLTADDYAYILAHSRSRAAFVSGALLDTLRQAMASGPNQVEHIVVSQPVADNNVAESNVAENNQSVPTLHEFEACMAAAAPRGQAARTLADEIAFWLYSSGSTGRPKGVVHSHCNLWYTAELYAKPVLGITENDITFSAAKLFFAYGLGNGLTFPLSVGATSVLMAERPTPAATYARIVDHQPTIFFGVPTLYASMLAHTAIPARSDVALRVCASAGEALPQDIGDRFTQHFGCEILDGIGSTEMLHIFLSNHSGKVRYGTTGLPVQGYEVELRDENGKPVGDGEIGDLYIRGPSAAVMYWNNREKTRQTFLGDWLKSGDKYQRDADGYYTYAGRSDDMLKVSGLYVSPVEVENVLSQHPAVLEAAVVGLTDSDGLVKTKAYVVLCQGNEPSVAMQETLKQFVKAHLAPFKYPRYIEFVDDLPKTATGKIQRFKLRQAQEAVAHPGAAA